ncbi:MAG: hypothetical protein EBZ00_02205 [Actinobacteria bacterium]|nr:hypothetical protein [Actinomycetota bacterium]
MARPIQIAPSVLPADFSKLGDAIVALDTAGVDLIQWDVMDGQFVPNLTFGPDVIASTRHLTKVPFEAHLMVLTPDVMARNYVEAGCQRLIVHVEACTHLHRTLGNIRDLGGTYRQRFSVMPTRTPEGISLPSTLSVRIGSSKVGQLAAVSFSPSTASPPKSGRSSRTLDDSTPVWASLSAPMRYVAPLERNWASLPYSTPSSPPRSAPARTCSTR